MGKVLKRRRPVRGQGRRHPLPPDKPEDKAAFKWLLSKGYTKMALADSVGISKQAVSRWKTVPLKYVTTVSEATGFSRKRLRPSDFA